VRACGYTKSCDKENLVAASKICWPEVTNSALSLQPFQLLTLLANLSLTPRYSFRQRVNLRTVDVWVLVITCIFVITCILVIICIIV